VTLATRCIWTVVMCGKLVQSGRATPKDMPEAHYMMQILQMCPLPVLSQIIASIHLESAASQFSFTLIPQILSTRSEAKRMSGLSGAVWSCREYIPSGGSYTSSIVMLHSMYTCSTEFEHVAPWLASQLQVRVICYDLLSRGASGVRGDDTEESLATDLLAFVQRDEVVHVCAASVHCRIGVLLAKGLKAQLGQLILVACSLGTPPTKEVTTALIGFLSQVRVPDQGREFLVQCLKQPGLLGQVYLESPEFATSRKALWAMISEENLPVSTKSIDWWLKWNEDVPHAFAGLSGSMLLICGAEDAAYFLGTKELHTAIPQSEIVMVENVGHHVAMEAPDQMARAIVSFIQKHKQQ